MRKLSEGEILSLTTMLKMENDSLAVAKAMQITAGKNHTTLLHNSFLKNIANL